MEIDCSLKLAAQYPPLVFFKNGVGKTGMR